MHIELRIREADSLLIEARLDLLKDIVARGVIILPGHIGHGEKIDGADPQLVDPAKRLRFRVDLRMGGKDIVDDLLGLFEIVVVADGDGLADAALAHTGIIDDRARNETAVWNKDLAAVGRAQFCVDGADVGDIAVGIGAGALDFIADDKRL